MKRGIFCRIVRYPCASKAYCLRWGRLWMACWDSRCVHWNDIHWMSRACACMSETGWFWPVKHVQHLYMHKLQWSQQIKLCCLHDIAIKPVGERVEIALNPFLVVAGCRSLTLLRTIKMVQGNQSRLWKWLYKAIHSIAFLMQSNSTGFIKKSMFSNKIRDVYDWISAFQQLAT